MDSDSVENWADEMDEHERKENLESWNYNEQKIIYDEVLKMTHNEPVARKVTGMINEGMSEKKWKSLSHVEQLGQIGFSLLALERYDPTLLDQVTPYKLGNLHEIVKDILSEFRKNVETDLQLTIEQVEVDINVHKGQLKSESRDEYMKKIQNLIQDEAMSEDMEANGLHRFRENARQTLQSKINAMNQTIQQTNANRSEKEKITEQLSQVTEDEKELAMQTLNQKMHRLSFWFQREVMIKFLEWVETKPALRQIIFKKHWFSRRALQAARKKLAEGTYHFNRSVIRGGLWEMAAWELAMRSKTYEQGEQDIEAMEKPPENEFYWASPYNPYLVRFQLASI